MREGERDKCLMSIRLTVVDLHICAYHIPKGHLSSMATAVVTNKITFWFNQHLKTVEKGVLLTSFKVSNHQDHPMIDQCVPKTKKKCHINLLIKRISTIYSNMCVSNRRFQYTFSCFC